MNATEQYFSVIRTAVQDVLNSESVDEILMCNQLNENFRAMLFCGDVCCPISGKI